MICKLGEKEPKIGKKVFVAENAAVIGDVVVGEGASIWFGASVRGDEARIEIAENANIQDNATLHGCVKIGHGVTVGHNAIVHGCTVGDNSLIGMGAVILDGAVIGENSIVGAGALVTMNKKFPPRSLIIGSPAVMRRELTDEEVKSIRKNAEEYSALSQKYLIK